LMAMLWPWALVVKAKGHRSGSRLAREDFVVRLTQGQLCGRMSRRALAVEVEGLGVKRRKVVNWRLRSAKCGARD
jgi:hypothetical protein